MKIKVQIKEFEKNIEDIYFPFITLEFEGKQKIVNLPVQILGRFLGFDSNEWVGKSLYIEKREARKYIRYFIDLKKFNFVDYKEYEIKQLQEIKCHSK